MLPGRVREDEEKKERREKEEVNVVDGEESGCRGATTQGARLREGG